MSATQQNQKLRQELVSSPDIVWSWNSSTTVCDITFLNLTLLYSHLHEKITWGDIVHQSYHCIIFIASLIINVIQEKKHWKLLKWNLVPTNWTLSISTAFYAVLVLGYEVKYFFLVIYLVFFILMLAVDSKTWNKMIGMTCAYTYFLCVYLFKCRAYHSELKLLISTSTAKFMISILQHN
jgi:hypothetical protein